MSQSDPMATICEALGQSTSMSEAFEQIQTLMRVTGKATLREAVAAVAANAPSATRGGSFLSHITDEKMREAEAEMRRQGSIR